MIVVPGVRSPTSTNATLTPVAKAGGKQFRARQHTSVDMCPRRHRFKSIRYPTISSSDGQYFRAGSQGAGLGDINATWPRLQLIASSEEFVGDVKLR